MSDLSPQCAAKRTSSGAAKRLAWPAESRLTSPPSTPPRPIRAAAWARLARALATTRSGPSSGDEAGAILGNGARAARDVRLAADHIRLAAAVPFCSDQAEKKGYGFLASTIRRREGAMTPAEQAFLLTGVLFCLSFATIFVFWFADRLRSNFLGKR
jgi:hypothetical protein